MTLLKRMRKFNKVLQKSILGNASTEDVLALFSEELDVNVYLFSKEGELLGYSRSIEYSVLDDYKDLFEGAKLNKEYLKRISEVGTPLYNLDSADSLSFNLEKGHDIRNKTTCILPVLINGDRLGTLIILSYDKELVEEDFVLAEFVSTINSIQIVNEHQNLRDEEERKTKIVDQAINSLSYSELEAIEHIFKELDGNEGLVVASKIADKVGITRSVIVNALRKFESAGVIKSRSLGMKGTHIQVLNSKLRDELKRRF